MNVRLTFFDDLFVSRETFPDQEPEPIQPRKDPEPTPEPTPEPIKSPLVLKIDEIVANEIDDINQSKDT